MDQAKSLAAQHQVFQIVFTLLHFLCTGMHQLASLIQVQKVAFKAQDMLQADLSDTAILMLASLCWDEHLFNAAAHKICHELPAESLVIDYTNRLDINAHSASSHGVLRQQICCFSPLRMTL